MHTRHKLRIGAILATLALVFVAGCPPRDRSEISPSLGRVYMFPGIEGNRWSMSWAYAGLRDGGVDAEICVVDWDRPIGGLVNLADYEGNRERAQRLAEEITQYRDAYPAAPVDLVGYSGGGGLAVMVVEELPEDVSVRNVVLAQAAVSPDYNLEQMLRRTDGVLVNFYSQYDWLILGLGTRVFGTMDREKTPSAGKVGFDLEQAVPDAKLRSKVEQVKWKPQMVAKGHWGGHAGMLGYYWNKCYVAPYLGGDDCVEGDAAEDAARP